MRKPQRIREFGAMVAAWMILTPVVAGAQITRPPAQPIPPGKGVSTGKKLLALGGAALLYYLYRKHQANQTGVSTAPGRTSPTAARRPQLYRSKNGGVYYREANGKPVWLTVPSRPVQVAADDLRRYAPDWQRYQRMPAPAAPSGYQTRPFTEFDRTLLNSGVAAPGPRM